jgi:phosphatidate cytidylyltransferase
LKQRIATGVILGIAFLGLLQWGGTPYVLLMMVMAVIGLFEFLRMHGYRLGDAAGVLGVLAILLLVFPWYAFESLRLPDGWGLIWLFLALLLSLTVLSRNRIQIRQIAVVAVGVLYIGFGFRSMTYIRLEEGVWWALMVFTCTWASDTGAYFTGRWLGKRPLLPSISPKKTVEGSLGGIVCAAALAVVYALFAPVELGVGQAVLLGGVIAVAGQWGDLIQSAYKRVNGVKDSGAIFPGHGGVLDRCDSWLIVFPLVHFMLTAIW